MIGSQRPVNREGHIRATGKMKNGQIDKLILYAPVNHEDPIRATKEMKELCGVEADDVETG